MISKIKLVWTRIQDGTLKKMMAQTRWIYQYARRYWKAMVLYTALGIMSSVLALGSSMISKDLVDIITGHETGKLISTFVAMIIFAMVSLLVSPLLLT